MASFEARAVRRGRAALLLAVYALFGLLSGLHLLEHGLGLPGASPDGPPRAVAGCGDDCDDPGHHHGHALHEPCTVCKALLAWHGLPPHDALGIAPASDAGQVRQDRGFAPRPCGTRAPRARGPPPPSPV